MSAIEVASSTLFGYVIATAANLYVLPLFGFAVSLADASVIGLIFTLISIVRSYVFRRLFNLLAKRNPTP